MVVEGIRQQPDEADEAFLMRAESVLRMEQDAIGERARVMAAAAIRAADKPDSPAREALTRMVEAAPDCYVTRRALLLARSLCRQQLEAVSGSDPVGQEAYGLLSRLALVALAPEA